MSGNSRRGRRIGGNHAQLLGLDGFDGFEGLLFLDKRFDLGQLFIQNIGSLSSLFARVHFLNLGQKFSSMFTMGNTGSGVGQKLRKVVKLANSGVIGLENDVVAHAHANKSNKGEVLQDIFVVDAALGNKLVVGGSREGRVDHAKFGLDKVHKSSGGLWDRFGEVFHDFSHGERVRLGLLNGGCAGLGLLNGGCAGLEGVNGGGSSTTHIVAGGDIVVRVEVALLDDVSRLKLETRRAGG